MIIETFESKQFHLIKIHRDKFLEHDVHNLEEKYLKPEVSFRYVGSLSVKTVLENRAKRVALRETADDRRTRLARNKLWIASLQYRYRRVHEDVSGPIPGQFLDLFNFPT